MTTAPHAGEFYRDVYRGSWVTQGLWVAAELGIADLLADGPKTAQTLADETGSHRDALHRVLRALAAAGVFEEDRDQRYALTPIGELLQSDVPGSQRAFATMMGAEFHRAWGALLQNVQTGVPGFESAFGASFFQHMLGHPERHRIYDAAMECIHGPETEPVLDACDLSGSDNVVDVGGGNGHALSILLRRFPHIHGTLFDMPAVAESARRFADDPQISERFTIRGGDFFESVPSGADAYLLRHIIHDWEDQDAITILRNCREAMNPSGRVLVIEMVIPPGNEPAFGKWLDLMMLLVRGRERTEEEYRDLYAAAGLELTRVIPTESEVSLVEGVRAR